MQLYLVSSFPSVREDTNSKLSSYPSILNLNTVVSVKNVQDIYKQLLTFLEVL